MIHLRYVLALLLITSAAQAQRSIIPFNTGWKFHLGNDSTASGEHYNDAGWRNLTLPHDWSIEGAFDSTSVATTQ